MLTFDNSILFAEREKLLKKLLAENTAKLRESRVHSNRNGCLQKMRPQFHVLAFSTNPLLINFNKMLLQYAELPLVAVKRKMFIEFRARKVYKISELAFEI